MLGFSLAVWAGLSLELAPQAFNLLYGVLPFFLFGLLLQHYPRWLRSRAVAQLRFSVIGLLLLTAQLFWLLNAWDLIGLLPYLIALFSPPLVISAAGMVCEQAPYRPGARVTAIGTSAGSITPWGSVLCCFCLGVWVA